MATLQLLSETLQGHNGDITRDSLRGKYVLMYFSAHWCGPCRGFTPKLVELYKKLKADATTKDKVEVVFVSSDNDEAQFTSYFEEMPWYALPYKERNIKAKLSRKLKVQGIPTLALFDTEGNLASNNIRSAVMADPSGKNFPWMPKTATEVLSDATFHKNDGSRVAFSTLLESQYIGLYFSAHWCPPCRQFTPNLVSTYTKLKTAGVPFEIVFMSRDQEEDDYNSYFGEMPWLALPMGDSRVDTLASTFQVQGIPSLIIIKNDGTVVNDDARGAVDSDPEGKNFPWGKKPLGPIGELVPEDSVMEALNGQICAVLSTRGVDAAEAKRATEEFTAAAIAFHDEVNSKLDEDERVAFLTATHEGLYDRILSVTNTTEVKGRVNLVLFNLPARATKILNPSTKDEVVAAVREFHAANQ